MQLDAMAECHHCGSKAAHHVSRAYDRQQSVLPQIRRSLKVMLVVGDCFFIGCQPVLVYMAKVDGKFLFAPVSVNFLTEIVKILFTLLGLLWHMRSQEKGEKSLFSSAVMIKAAKANWMLAIPASMYAINNYLKFSMQLYFQPSTVKMLGNLKLLVIALLLKMLMRKRFSIMQWECLILLLIGVSVNQLQTASVDATAIAIPLATAAYVSTLMYVTVPALASVYSEKFLKTQFETNIHLQNLSLYGYGALFNLIAICAQNIYLDGGIHLNILEGHSFTTMLLICNNAAQGILSSFFFKYADTILKKYSSTVATIFTGLLSYFLFGHALTINFVLGCSIVLISMHQYYSYENSSKVADQNGQHFDSKSSDIGLSKKNHSNLNEAMLKDANLALPSHIIGVMGEREPLLSRTFSSPRVQKV
ncbi:hypothetical protein M758_11G148300 [Ceratodon purpureus]|nr:hypothetical protein M758_11G148300 [Ceratodon purpureus]